VRRTIDRVGDGLGRLAGWVYVAAGVMIVWEVAARYLFVAPTIWAEELSRLALVWATFLPMAALLRRRAHIRITLVTEHLGPAGRRACDVFGLLWVGVLCAIVVWYGIDIAADSWRVERTTGTMMDVPNWWTEAAVPLGFLLLGLQCLVEIVRVLTGADAAAAGGGSA
jgi:TRAP-type C4-dicarboxylate transport system permease small subunit